MLVLAPQHPPLQLKPNHSASHQPRARCCYLHELRNRYRPDPGPQENCMAEPLAVVAPEHPISSSSTPAACIALEVCLKEPNLLLGNLRLPAACRPAPHLKTAICCASRGVRTSRSTTGTRADACTACIFTVQNTTVDSSHVECNRATCNVHREAKPVSTRAAMEAPQTTDGFGDAENHWQGRRGAAAAPLPRCTIPPLL